MTQATALTAIWPRVALFNYFAVPMPPQPPSLVHDTWSGISTNAEHDELAAKRLAQRLAERTKRGMP